MLAGRKDVHRKRSGGTDEVSVLLWTYPDVAVAPLAEVTQLLDFWVGVVDVVFYGEGGGVVNADVAAEAEEDAACFEG